MIPDPRQVEDGDGDRDGDGYDPRQIGDRAPIPVPGQTGDGGGTGIGVSAPWGRSQPERRRLARQPQPAAGGC
jgi:hypothetical protein